MAKKIIKAQMKQRLDTKANWAAQNPVLLAGELGIVSDDPNLYKVGDGTTAWNALPFRGFDGTLVHTTGDSETAAMSQKSVTEELAKLEPYVCPFNLGDYEAMSLNESMDVAITAEQITSLRDAVISKRRIFVPRYDTLLQANARISYDEDRTIFVVVQTDKSAFYEFEIFTPDSSTCSHYALQQALISGVNIMTINGESIVGFGDLEIDSYTKEETDNIKIEIWRTLDTIDSRVDSLEEIHETLDVTVAELVENKVDAIDYAPKLTAGYADNLVGRGESVVAEINFRPSGGGSINDGTARIAELKGNSVVWNQLAKALSVADVFPPEAQIEDTTAVFSNWTAYQYFSFNAAIKSRIEHRLLFAFSYTNDSASPRIDVEFGGMDRFFFTESAEDVVKIFTISNAVTTDAITIFPITDQQDVVIKHFYVYDLTKMFGEGNEPTTIEEFYQRIPQNIDINAYNEGEVISYKGDALKSVGFNAWDEQWENGVYNENTGEKIDSVDAKSRIRCKNPIFILPNTKYYFNIPDLAGGSYMGSAVFLDKDKNYISKSAIGPKAYLEVNTPSNAVYMLFYLRSEYGTTYNNDICINLAHTGYRNGEYEPYMEFTREIDPRIREAFPDGMKSAGIASDKVYNRNGKGVIEKRIGAVDLGTLNWNYSRGVFITYIKDIKGIDGANEAKMSKYNIAKSIYGEEMYNNVEDKVYKTNGGAVGGSKSLAISDSSYTDAASFKAAMQGVMLYYELAEPIVTEYDEPFNLDYQVWDFGTEESISEGASAPLRADIIYQFNAVDNIRNNKLTLDDVLRRLQQLESMVSTMQAASVRVE